MTRWVDADDAQKFRQYTVPHARKQLAAGVFDAQRAEVLADVAREKERHAASALADRDARLERHLARLRRQWAAVAEAERFARWAVAQ
jgi:hypothetical protein